MTEYLRLDDLLAIETALGSPGVRDVGLLESALARPQATVFGDDAYPTLALKAAALVHSIVTNHALVDGNKRLGLVALRLFVGLNDHDIVATQDEKFDLIMAIAGGDLRDVEDIADRVRSFLVPVE
ncbi:type II toxin-antitoxin system death-on-curing family toxin [Nocardioides immobilis]|uniref:Type II toxin-antitoxin system death-on-curing family toxin n=1 Tax=Nocardioides immobilis TaxID=2049295 RepID=A0A417Y6X5_9ACTN|nr:type II toxin-antitoxin system death-on-curing family toxin [Nocardioides immobilis]RHW28246.1 type II toxin-antitoxin system death-on-curing family toxin [Nocardioides immobilis]